ASATIQMGGENVGDLLTAKGVTWGWFQGGFASPGYVPGQPSTDNPAAVCTGSHHNILGNTVKDYSPHHEPFQYYTSTANPQHLPPTSVADIGQSDQANHQYDLADFFAAADAGNLPAVSYLKAPAYQDAHAGYSDPADEQQWLVSTVNHLEQLPSWKSTAVVITYDDSDGWYDHVFSPVQTGSQTSLDTLNGAGQCGTAGQVPVNSAGQPEQARCGLGVRLPFLVISRYAKGDFVDHTAISQASVVKFIEENWGVPALGNGAVDTSSGSIDSMLSFDWPLNFALFLNPATGEPGNSGLGG
ncbi:MAG TPA: alkaline phosphatase family protein, partial [Streptosporangiaceae bacterium]|nr:alkaline phosphatase family protein [Streptosporangiaceae bacterium]